MPLPPRCNGTPLQFLCPQVLYWLAQTTQPIMLIQDGARYHTAAKTQAFFAKHAERLMVQQLR